MLSLYFINSNLLLNVSHMANFKFDLSFGKEQPVDVLTKPLVESKFNQHCTKIMVRTSPLRLRGHVSKKSALDKQTKKIKLSIDD